MSRKYSGNDLEKRWVFSHWWNVHNDEEMEFSLEKYICNHLQQFSPVDSE